MKENNPFFQNLLLILYSVVLVFSFFKTYNYVFDEKVHLGGDNAGYYILGKSLATGQGYSNIHTNGKSHTHFSPGYPTIIALTMFLTNDKIITLKKVNGVLFLLSIGLLFLIVFELTRNYHIAFLASLFSVLNFHLLNYSSIMMSEIPFLFFSSLSFYLFIKTDYSKPIIKNWLFWLMVIFISITYYIRPTGVALIFGMSLFLFISGHRKYSVTLFLSNLALALPWFIRGKNLGGSSYINQLLQINPYRPEEGNLDITSLISRIWENFERYITREIPSGINNELVFNSYDKPIESSEWILGLLIASVIIFGVVKLKSKGLPLVFYILSTFAILLVWPPIWTGPRFIVPLIPFLTFLFIWGAFKLLEWTTINLFKLKKPVYLIIFIVSISVLYGFTKYDDELEVLHLNAELDYPKNFKHYFEMAEWVKNNTSDSSITCCRKGQLFYLFSQKRVVRYKYTEDTNEQISWLSKKGVNYVAFLDLGYASTGKYLYPAVKNNSGKFKPILHLTDPESFLLEFTPTPNPTAKH